MWLSKSLFHKTEGEKAQKGSVTISSSGNMETGSTANSRNTDMYLPYGYSALPPVGEEVLILPACKGQAIMGTLSKPKQSLQSGEIRLCSAGGATIELRNDGAVVINSLVINKNGVIET